MRRTWPSSSPCCRDRTNQRPEADPTLPAAAPRLGRPGVPNPFQSRRCLLRGDETRVASASSSTKASTIAGSVPPPVLIGP